MQFNKDAVGPFGVVFVTYRHKILDKGPCKIYGLNGASANGARDHDFFYTYEQWWRQFLENIHTNSYFVHFHALFFTLDTTCADNKDKPITGCKNQLIKKCCRNVWLITFITWKP